jgi:hypothetical protein
MDTQVVLDAAILSRMAYQPNDEVQKTYNCVKQGEPCEDTTTARVMQRVLEPPTPIPDETGKVRGYGIKYQAGIQIVVFEGTQFLEDFYCDVEVWLITYPPHTRSSVHEGFLRRFLSMEKYISSYINPENQVLFTGHSLGSAVAAIAAMMYNNSFYVGFGTPRVGNAHFVDMFKQNALKYLRVKYGRDPINSIIPPIKYAHIDKDFHIGPPDRFSDLPQMEYMCDHSIILYIHSLTSIVMSERHSAQQEHTPQLQPL